jgi:hypothetical protein
VQPVWVDAGATIHIAEVGVPNTPPVTHPPPIRAVTVEVQHGANASRFLFDLLRHLKAVDSSAQIIPHPEALEGTLRFSDPSALPNDGTQQQFVEQYLAGIRVVSTKLICKFWMNSDCPLSVF